jgi:hypothetical protein
MDKTYKDTDLREALHRKYADTPQLPVDFMAKMEQRMDAKPNGRTRRLWPWLSIAASILLIIGISMTLMPTEQQDKPEPLVAKNVKTEPAIEQTSDSNTLILSQRNIDSLTEKGLVAHPSRRTESLQVTNQASVSDGPKAVQHDSDSESMDDPNLHYASNDLTKDTVPYQDPARVDEFISQLADYHQVKQGELKCSQPVDDNVVSTVYVFPDKDEINLFSRLLQVACWYDSKTSGYHLNFSQQQFFFELKDMRKQLQYRWIAERINGRILFYGTHTPLGTKESSACYQQYRDELMYQNSINIKTKKI